MSFLVDISFVAALWVALIFVLKREFQRDGEGEEITEADR